MLPSIPSRVRARLSLALAWTVAVGTVAAIAISDGVPSILHALGHLQPEMIALAFGMQLVAYAGYIAAYRSSAHAPGRPLVPLRTTIALVVAGFGPSTLRGGFSLDRRALCAVHRDARAARVHVLSLGIVEYFLLAPAAWVCALILLIGGHASLALTLPWVVAVPPGLLLALWVSQPLRTERWSTGRGWARELRTDVLSGLGVLRRIGSAPRAHAGAIVGMALYWGAEIACLGVSLLAFGVELSAPALVVAHATGYAASRRSLPLGGAGITEALMTLALIWVGVAAPTALVSVALYRALNLVAPSLPALLAQGSIRHLLERGAALGETDARSRQ